jgi:ubiquinone/menaquinone biosynthesis C-methylase UbiE
VNIVILKDSFSMERILEPEVMDDREEALEYDAMDFTEVNTNFAKEAVQLAGINARVLDVGTGTARIPIMISQLRPQWQIIAIDLADSMLEIGQKNILNANCQEQIKLEKVDGKNLPYQSEQFDLVISNSLIHHLENPLPFLREIKRVLKPNGGIFLRDLFRPDSEEIIKGMVREIDPNFSLRQAQLFQDSLRAAFTLAEIADLIQQSGLENVKIYQSSERHWTAIKTSKN